MKYVYKITYPNEKIYIGQDRKDLYMTYFGSPCQEYVNKDFSWDEVQNITIRKEIIFSSDKISNAELHKEETKLILKFESNNPKKGYNLKPKWKEG